MLENPPSKEIDDALSNLDGDKDKLLELCLQMMNAYEGALYPLDFFASAAANRSIHMIDGFIEMIRTRNMTCAGALLRIHLDTTLRFYAAWLVDDPHKLATQVLEGVPIRKMKDSDGFKMTDRYLVSKLSVEYPWVERVYEKTCSFIHFSETHLLSIVTEKPHEKNRTVGISVGGKSNHIPDSILLEAIAAFRQATLIFAKYLHGWSVTKDAGGTKNNPPD